MLCFNILFYINNIDPTIKMMLNRILIKIANIENILSKNTEDKSALLDEPFLSKFPITNPEGLLLVESCTLNEHNYDSKLVNNLFSHINTITCLLV